MRASIALLILSSVCASARAHSVTPRWRIDARAGSLDGCYESRDTLSLSTLSLRSNSTPDQCAWACTGASFHPLADAAVALRTRAGDVECACVTLALESSLDPHAEQWTPAPGDCTGEHDAVHALRDYFTLYRFAGESL